MKHSQAAVTVMAADEKESHRSERNGERMGNSHTSVTVMVGDENSNTTIKVMAGDEEQSNSSNSNGR